MKEYNDTATDALQFAKDFLYKGITFTDTAAVRPDPHFNGVWKLTGVTEYGEDMMGIIYLPGDYPHNEDTPAEFQGDVEIGEETEHEYSVGYR